MDFVGKSFSGVLKIVAILAVVVIFGYLLIYAIPFLLVAGIAVYVFLKLKKYFKINFAIKNANANANANAKTMNNTKEETNFKAYDNLDGEVIDVDYKDA